MTEGAAQATGSAAPWLERAARRPVLALLLLAMLAWLPGLSTLPPLDRDESRFAEASRQMAETGNYIDIRFASGTRYNKPIEYPPDTLDQDPLSKKKNNKDTPGPTGSPRNAGATRPGGSRF